MKEALLKSWRTTLVGLVLVGYLAYKLFFQGHEIDTQTVLEMLVALGFLSSGDGAKSSTQSTVPPPGTPPKKDEPGN